MTAHTPTPIPKAENLEQAGLTDNQRLGWGLVLGLIFALAVGGILFFWPLYLVVWLADALAAGAALGAFVRLVWPRETLNHSFAAGAVCTGLIAALMAVPAIQDSHREPFTAELDFKISGCEGFIVNNALLKSLPRGKRLNAKWAYKNNGANDDAGANLIVRGRSDDAVILQRLSVVGFKREPPQNDVSEVLPCWRGGGEQPDRRYQVVLKDRPRIIPLPSLDENGDVSGPPVPFPFKVSKSDPEYFRLELSGPPCVCTWRLALDWSSGGRSGTKIFDHASGVIRSHLPADGNGQLGYYERGEDGEWTPPLPE